MDEEVPRPLDDLQQHRVAHPERAGQHLRLGRDQPLEGRLAPADKALRGLLALDPLELLGVVAGLGDPLGVLDIVLGGLHDDRPAGVVAGPPRAPGDLVELAGLEVAHLHPVVLGQTAEQHRADRHVDPDAEGVGAGDHLEQAGLGEQLDQPAVLRQHPGVVHADAVPDQPGQRPAEALGEAEVADQLGDRVLLLATADVDAHQRLRLLDRRGLGEVHDVDRRPVGAQQLLEGLVQRRRDVLEVQRDRAVGAHDQCALGVRAPLQVVLEPRDVAEGGAHEDELRVDQLDQRNLPGPAAVGLGVEVELVHDDEADVGVRALTQRQVGEDLGGAADDRRTAVDGGVAGHHPDVLGPELRAEGEELLAHQRLDRRGVERPLAVGQRPELRAGRDHRLPAAGRRGQDDVVAADDLQQRLLLRRVEAQPLLAGPQLEGLEDGVGRDRAGDELGQRHAVR